MKWTILLIFGLLTSRTVFAQGFQRFHYKLNMNDNRDWTLQVWGNQFDFWHRFQQTNPGILERSSTDGTPDPTARFHLPICFTLTNERQDTAVLRPFSMEVKPNGIFAEYGIEQITSNAKTLFFTVNCFAGSDIAIINSITVSKDGEKAGIELNQDLQQIGFHIGDMSFFRLDGKRIRKFKWWYLYMIFGLLALSGYVFMVFFVGKPDKD